MAGKKEFKSGNPALELLGVTSEEAEVKDVLTEKKTSSVPAKKKTKNNAGEKKKSTSVAENRKKDKGRAEKKAEAGAIPEGYVLKPEAKSERINLLIQPTLYKEAKKKAKKEKISFNELLCRAVRDYIDE